MTQTSAAKGQLTAKINNLIAIMDIANAVPTTAPTADDGRYTPAELVRLKAKYATLRQQLVNAHEALISRICYAKEGQSKITNPAEAAEYPHAIDQHLQNKNVNAILERCEKSLGRVNAITDSLSFHENIVATPKQLTRPDFHSAVRPHQEQESFQSDQRRAHSALPDINWETVVANDSEAQQRPAELLERRTISTEDESHHYVPTIYNYEGGIEDEERKHTDTDRGAEGSNVSSCVSSFSGPPYISVNMLGLAQNLNGFAYTIDERTPCDSFAGNLVDTTQYANLGYANPNAFSNHSVSPLEFFNVFKRCEPVVQVVQEPQADAQVSEPAHALPTEFFANLVRRGAKLPVATLPIFDGTPEKYNAWWERYRYAIHENHSLSANEKITYLKSCVSGQAEELLAPYNQEDNTYEECVNAILRTFAHYKDESSKIAKELNALPTCAKEAKALRQNFTFVQTRFLSLNNVESAEKSTVLFNIITAKFPRSVRRKLLQHRSDLGTDWSIPASLELLEAIVNQEENTERDMRHTDSLTPQQAPNTIAMSATADADNADADTANAEKAKTSRKSPRTNKCLFCGLEEHQANTCTAPMTPKKRTEITLASGGCLKCLHRHNGMKCKRQPCAHCQLAHHELLCFRAAPPSSNRQSIVDKRESKPPTETTTKKERREAKKKRRKDKECMNEDRGEGDKRSVKSVAAKPCTPPINHSSIHNSIPIVSQQSPTVSPPILNVPPVPAISEQGTNSSKSMFRSNSGLPPKTNRRVTFNEEVEVRAMSVAMKETSTPKASRPELPTFADPTDCRFLLVHGRCESTEGYRYVKIAIDASLSTSTITPECLDFLRHETTDEETDAEDRKYKIFLAPANTPVVSISCTIKGNAPTYQTLTMSAKDTAMIRQSNIAISQSSGEMTPDIIVGTDQLLNIMMLDAPIVKLPSGIVLYKTIFGNALSCFEISADTAKFCTNAAAIAEEIANPWSLEAIGIKDDPSASADDAMDALIVDRIRREAVFRDGCIFVPFPWKDNHPAVADNRAMAYRRLLSVYMKYGSNKELWDEYNKIIQEQIDAGILEYAPVVKSKTRPVYYIPHKPIIKDSSNTTKFRLVLDASSHGAGAVPVNDAIHQGPAQMPDITGLQFRAREHKYLVTADVEKAFHQIRLLESDRDACRILWFKDHNAKNISSADNIIELRYTRIPFGINASPFLLGMGITLSLERLCHRLKDRIIRDMYVDNLFLGCATEDECKDIYRETKTLFTDMHMNLREFTSSSEETRAIIEPPDKSKAMVQSKLLGTPWNTETDEMTVPFHAPIITSKYTKRSMLSAYAKTFDPLGLLSPIFIKFKITLSEIFRGAGGWDDEVDVKHAIEWDKLINDVTPLNISFPRSVTIQDPNATQSLVIFCDASKLAYGVVAYVKTEFSDGRRTTSHILCSKARVTPQNSTIPRLELMAMGIGVRLAHFICEQMDTPFKNIHILSDSMVALNWTNNANTLKTFANNRVQEIRRIVEKLQNAERKITFAHVRTDQNPADATSRGLTAFEFADYFWQHGPEWVKLPYDSWPIECKEFTVPDEFQREFMDEIKIVASHASVRQITSPIESAIPFKRTYDLHKLERITANVIAFFAKRINHLTPDRKKRWHQWLPALEKCKHGIVDHDTKRAAADLLLREHQRVNIVELRGFMKHEDTTTDSTGILRYRGRIGPTAGCNPALLSHNHAYADLVMIASHHKCGHQGEEATLAELRREYWLVKGYRKAARGVTRSCVICRRFNSRPFSYPRAPQLPESRVRADRPFLHCGMDYAGPFTVTQVVGNVKNVEKKAWIAIFTCITTRAVHLELLANQDTTEFVIAVSKFFSRYGTPASITLDNAPTFKAGAQVLNQYITSQEDRQELDMSRLGTKISGVKWMHITPYSPWKGGIYERLVGSVKLCLKKTIGNSHMSFRLFEATLLGVEGILNRRPITKSSDHPKDLTALRPIDFLIPYKYTPFILKDLENDDEYSPSVIETHEAAKNWIDSVARRLDSFWEHWSVLYISQLRERNRLLEQSKGSILAPRVGELVLCTDANASRDKWKMGLIVRLIRSEDKAIRAVIVRNHKGNEVEKCVKHIVPLEISSATPTTPKEKKTTIIEKRVQPARDARKPVNYSESKKELLLRCSSDEE